MSYKNTSVTLHGPINKRAPTRGYLIKERETKKLIVELPIEAHIQVEQMKLDLRKSSIKEVVREALNDFFKKYGYPPIA